MESKPIFRQEDRDNLELVRQIVLYRLKHDDQWNQLDYHWHPRSGGRYVDFETGSLRKRFMLLVNEVMWQLIAQGVITPGMNASNPALPFFRITDYGQKVLESERFIPHDPTGYLNEIQELSETKVTSTAIAYLEEALKCFNAGCNIASVLMLGIAAEEVFLQLCEVVYSSLPPSDQQDFDKMRWIKGKHRWVVRKYLDLPYNDRSQLPESLDVTLTSLYELIRRQRNELGHPQENPPELDREEAFVFFRLFPGFVRDVEAFARFCQDNEL